MPSGLRSFAAIWAPMAKNLGQAPVRIPASPLQPRQSRMADSAGSTPAKGTVLNVYQAINQVQSALAQTGITKDRKNQQQGYAFRGIDDVYNALSPLLAKAGLCILPRVVSRECVERQTAKGGTLFYVTVEAEFDFVSAEDGSKHTVKTFGEAMDSGDKATNKAMSAAYKYAAFQAFAIPTEGDNDADAHHHQPAPKADVISPTREAWNMIQPEQQQFLRSVAQQIVKAMPDTKQAHQIIFAADLDQDHKAALWHLLDAPTRKALKESANV